MTKRWQFVSVFVLVLVSVSCIQEQSLVTPTLSLDDNPTITLPATSVPSSIPIITSTPILTSTSTPTLIPTKKSTPTITPTPTQYPELSEQAITNLTAFARLYGYVRYFHPSDQAAEADWEQVALRGVRVVVDAATPEELAADLAEIFTPLAPTLQVFVIGQEPAAVDDLWPPEDTPGLQVVMWEHHGVQGTTGQDELYKSTRLMEPVSGGEIPEGFADPRMPFEADLGGGVAIRLPLTVFADTEGTWPFDFDIPEKPALGQMLTPRQANQLAGVTIAWNVFQHFYPYFDVVDVDWTQVLLEALTEVHQISSDMEYFLFWLRFVTRLDDGHGFVSSTQYNFYYLPPVLLDWVEGQVVVTNVFKGAKSSIHPGDIILAVNGVPITEYLAGISTQISAATVQWERLFWLSGAQGTEVNLNIQTPSGEQKTVTLLRKYWFHELSPTHSDLIEELEPGIFYVNLDLLTKEQFNIALPRLEKAAGIVFDVRGRPPRIPSETIGHFIDKPVTSAQWHVPIVRYPDQQNVTFDFSNWEVEPIQPRLTDNLVFITNGRAISYAETYLGIIKYHQIGKIVGQPTAGTNGNVNRFSLPWDFAHIMWTGMKVLKHDGSQHHGVGILPDVPVEQTIQGLAEGRDEYLEAALEIVRQNQ